jgi:vacuolar-type H+-ATPase subunit E/Vma4
VFGSVDEVIDRLNEQDAEAAAAYARFEGLEAREDALSKAFEEAVRELKALMKEVRQLKGGRRAGDGVAKGGEEGDGGRATEAAGEGSEQVVKASGAEGRSPGRAGETRKINDTCVWNLSRPSSHL